MMNHYNPDSVVSAINRQAGIAPVPVPRELMQVLTRAIMVSERTAGAFDITIGSLRGWRFNPQDPGMPKAEELRAELPLVNYRNIILDESAGTAFLARKGMRIDLGGIAKLYILDAGMGVLKRNWVTHAMINGGGDVAVLGTIQGRSWRVGVRDPQNPDRIFAIVELQRGFVVSSGDYERYFMRDGKRYHHILDPKTGYPTAGPRGVTLVSQDANLVNGLSSAIMVLGQARGRELIEQQPAMEGIIFGQDGIWVSALLKKRLVQPAPP
jgi:thiamine biosynthesis lipoprotein